VLSRAVLNSLDQSKQKSWRYDGSFGDKDTKLDGEMTGQKAKNGDSEFYIKLSTKDKSTSYHVIKKGQDYYYLVSGVDSIPGLVAIIPGAKVPDPVTSNILSHLNNTWIKVPASEQQNAEKLVPCSGTSLILPTVDELKQLTSTDMPVEITGGPYSANDGTQSRVFQVGLKQSRHVTHYEGTVSDFISCLDSLRGDDFKLRKVNSQDINSLRFNITVDPLSNTLSKVLVNQFSQYFQLNLRDYNKDISIQQPDSSTTLSDFVNGLDKQTQNDLILKTALHSF
jgi:hypothetical protein